MMHSFRRGLRRGIHVVDVSIEPLLRKVGSEAFLHYVRRAHPAITAYVQITNA